MLRRIAALILICSHASALRPTRRQALKGTAGSTVMLNFLPGAARAAAKGLGLPTKETNDVVSTVDGIRRKRLGNSDIAVSELALGTQRWGGADFNSPDEELCHQLLDRGVLEGGINLIDTAEQYPIPSDRSRPEGATEEIIGRWLKKGTGRRNKVVLASKITGGRNINKRSIREDCEGSLKRLGVDTLDVYLLHWPARYTPQSNWGQSLEYDWDLGAITVPSAASFREIVSAMGELIREGKIRGYGACNDNAVGLMGMYGAARELGVPGPLCMQNDYSIVNRRVEENGLSEASSPAIANAGFMAYNVLAGGMLTGKYGLAPGDGVAPAAVDDGDRARAKRYAEAPRGRMDTRGWGLTLGRYRTTAMRSAAAQYTKLAKEYGIKGGLTELSFRFVAGRKAVTSSLVGHTSLAQLDASIDAYRKAAKGPLPDQLLWDIDRVHLQNRLPLFANDEAGKDWRNEGFIGERIP
uniref:NADP-dependent oxidoreductase domain-containing protein n=1 Tax=Pelagomonas calceolata TaxID=35677 RepID=A0A7S3ZQL0_9STRA|mmetsp:Transcript_12820/g.37408  ORF Transcript_12820/g.37408 Transcript_12820/m.37408 type:complete len:469 (-) Transcript_12820:166-1572(-)